MKKIIFAILFLFATPVFAGNNLTFTCTDSACTKSSNLPLFSEQNIYPTYLVSQKTTIVNNRSTDCNLNFKLQNQFQPDILSSVLTVSSISDSNVWYSGLFSGLFDSQSHSLGSVPANSSRDIVWTTSFNQDAGNEYQNVSNLFDMDFNFTCDDSSSAPSTGGGSVTGGNGGGSSSPLVCNDVAPNSTPQGLTATAGNNSVTLSWAKPDGNFTYYLIAFGTTPAADQYGNPNIGGPNTSSYTINGLSAGTTYYFKIRTGNGCAPGSFSGTISATPGGQVLANPGVPAGFQPGVLGAQTSNPSSPEGPAVLGATSTAKTSTCYWVFKYLFILIILVNILLRKKKIIALILSLIIFLIDWLVIGPNCRWWFWYILDLFSFALPFLILK